MTLEEFEKSLGAAAPEAGLSPYLQALWHDGRGDWARAHGIVQEIDDATAAWIHAYLHRKEGDAANAGYWYARASRSFPRGMSLEEEWRRIASSLL